MAECPNCERQLKPNKSWTFQCYNVEAYSCNCGTRFRKYFRDEKHVFSLRLAEDGKWRKLIERH